MFSSHALRASLGAALIAAVAFFGATPTAALAQAASEPAAQAAPAAPAATPAPAVAAVSEEAVENPYGLKALWAQGDFVAKGTLVIMLIMSMVHHLHQALRAAQHAQERRGRRRRLLEGQLG
jgi:biopolymer transport protein ExbB